MKFEVVSPATEEARGLICALDSEMSALYPGYPTHVVDSAELEKAGGYFVVVREANGQAVACGGFLQIDERFAEIKRMYVRPGARRHGLARQILRHLEEEVRRRGFRSIVLATGYNNAGAIALYEDEGYLPIPAFLCYVDIPISRCYAKSA